MSGYNVAAYKGEGLEGDPKRSHARRVTLHTLKLKERSDATTAMAGLFLFSLRRGWDFELVIFVAERHERLFILVVAQVEFLLGVHG